MRNSSHCWTVLTSEPAEKKVKEIPALFDLNFQVPRGRLVGVAGGVGAGKSSLISAILGEVRGREREKERRL